MQTTGIVNKFAAPAVLALALAAAFTAVPAQARTSASTPSPTCTKFGALGVCTTLNTVNFRFTTAKPTTAKVSTSVDKSYALTVLDSRAKKVHSITIRSEAPATTYNFLVQAFPKKGRPYIWKSTFATAAIGSVPATVTSANGKLLLNGVPFFPIMALEESCPTAQMVDDNVGLGVNMFDGGFDVCIFNASDPTSGYQAVNETLGTKAWWRDNANSNVSQADVPAYLSWQASIRLKGDLAPFGKCKSNQALSLNEDYQSLMLSGSMIDQFFLIDHFSPSEASCLTGNQFYSAFWLAMLTNKMKGAEYWSQYPWQMDAGVHVNPDIRSAATEILNQSNNLEPCLMNGAYVPLKSAPGSSVKAGLWQYGGGACIVAENLKPVPSQAASLFSAVLNRYTVARVPSENRTVAIRKGVLIDSFQGLGVHLYVLTPTPKIKK